MADGIFRRFLTVVFDRESARKVEGQLEGSLQSAGKKGGENFLRELRAAFDKRIGDLKVQLAKGLIDPAQFKAQSNLAAKEFNAGIVKGMEEARKAGTLTEKEYLKLSRTMKRVGDEGVTAWDRIKRGITTAGTALAAAFGARAIARFLGSTIQEANAAAVVWNRLAGALDTVGVAFADVEHEVTRAAAAMQRSTTVGDEEFAAVLTELITTSGDYAKSLQNVQLVADLAAAKQIDLKTAAQLVGRVLVGETGTLKRYGIVVAEGADALETMRLKFAGMAENEARTFAGRLKQLNNAWGDFKEALGEALIDASRGPSILDRVTRSVGWLTDNIASLMALVGNLTRAIVIVAGAMTLGRLVTAIRAADFAVKGFLVTMRTGWALLGPAGWFVLGVATLTTLFQRMGKAARDAAADARRAMEDYRDAAAAADDAQLALMETSLDARAEAIKTRLAQLRHGGAAVRAEQQQLITELNAVQDRMEVLRRERGGRVVRPTRSGTGDPDAPTNKRADREKALAAELERINRELHVRLLMQEKGYTRDLAAEMVRREELVTGQTRQIVDSVEEGWKRLDASDLLERAGLNKPLTPTVTLGTRLDEPEMRPLVDVPVQEQAANQVETAWTGALAAIAEQVDAEKGLFHDLGVAWAEGGFAGIAAYARAKVKENVAAAIENTAKAIGSFFLGNPGASAGFLKAAATHTAAAGAWRVAAGLGGGGGGPGGSAAGSSVPPNLARGSSAERAGPEVHIHLNGPGFHAANPEVQRVVMGAQAEARERYGQNASVQLHRGNA